ncbi:10221_t:CDS:2, partial [Racocetra persica]
FDDIFNEWLRKIWRWLRLHENWKRTSSMVEIALREENFQDVLKNLFFNTVKKFRELDTKYAKKANGIFNKSSDIWNERGSKMFLKCLSDNYARSAPVASTSSAMRHIPPNSICNVSTSKYCVATSNECSSLDPVNVSEPAVNITEATLRKTVTEEVLDICESLSTIRMA